MNPLLIQNAPDEFAPPRGTPSCQNPNLATDDSHVTVVKSWRWDRRPALQTPRGNTFILPFRLPGEPVRVGAQMLNIRYLFT